MAYTNIQTPEGLSFSSAAYGGVPNPTAIPASQYQETQAADPGLTALSTPANSVIGGQLAGNLSPETINALKNNSAAYGVTSGTGGSQFAGQQGLASLGLNVEQMQNQGLGNYLNSLKTVGSMQLDPSLVSSINTYNNQLAAAPNPAAAAAQENALWLSRYNLTRSPAGGTATHGPGNINYGNAGLGFKPGSTHVSDQWNTPNWDSGIGGGSINNIGVFGPTGYTEPAQNPTYQVPGGWGDTGTGTGTSYIGAAPGDPNYDPTIDPSSPGYDPYAMPPTD